MTISKTKLKKMSVLNKKYYDGKEEGERADFREMDLSKQDFYGFNFQEGDFQNVNLSGADLQSCNLCHADFENANLKNAHLGGADLSEACFFDANLKDTTLWGADMHGAQLDGADMRGAQFDYASWPIHCHGTGVIMGEAEMAMLAQMFCLMKCKGKELKAFQKKLLPLAKKSRRWGQC